MNINFIQTINTFKFVVWVFYILGSNFETWVTSLCLTGCLLKLANRFSDMEVLISCVRKRVERAFWIMLTKSQALFGTLGSCSCQYYKKQTFLTSVHNTNTHKCHLMTLHKQCSVGLDHTINLQQTSYVITTICLDTPQVCGVKTILLFLIESEPLQSWIVNVRHVW